MSEIPGFDLNQLIQIGVMFFWIFFMFKAQAIQYYTMKSQVEKHLIYLRFLRNQGKMKVLKAFREEGNEDLDLPLKLEVLLEHRLLMPSSLDPAGVVDRIGHIVDVRDQHFESEIKKLLPKLPRAQRMNMDNVLQIGYGLSYLYKIVRHFYLTAEKTKNFYLILQLNMILPEIVGYAKAYAEAFQAFRLGQPIGDGIGPQIVSSLMKGKKVERIVKDMSYASKTYKGRKVHLLKAEGPGGTVGNLDKGVEAVLKKDKNIKAIITIDAGLKMQGEPTGYIEEGIGVAIGGIGVERFNIEKIATREKIPVYCILVKQEYVDAISPMKDDILNASEEVQQRIVEYIEDKAEKGESVLVVGVGNTIGVGQ